MENWLTDVQRKSWPSIGLIAGCMLWLALATGPTQGAALGVREFGAPLNGGASVRIAYDSSPVDDDDRTIDLPLDRQIRVGLGAEYEKRKDLVLGFGYVYLDAGDATVNQADDPLTGDIKGEFERNAVHFLNVNARWRF
jgi:long-chain fatty acid transport protein